MKSLALRVLSDFGVDGVEPQALGSRKGRLALCALALAQGQVVPSDVLVDTLWGDAPPAQPEDQLAVLISRLRSVLGRDRIQHRDRGYLLVCDCSTRPSWPRSPRRWTAGAARATCWGRRPRPGSPCRCCAATGCRRYLRAGQAGVDRFGTLGPQPGTRIVGGPQPRCRTARTACASHHASSSS